jgi:hypothetical protein
MVTSSDNTEIFANFEKASKALQKLTHRKAKKPKLAM